MTYEEYCNQRDSYGLTDYAISSMSEVSRATLSQWKKGRSKPSKSTINKIKRVFAYYESLENENPGRFEMIKRITAYSGSPLVPVKTELDVQPEVTKLFIKLNDGSSYEISNEDYKQLSNAINAFTYAWLKEKNINTNPNQNPNSNPN